MDSTTNASGALSQVEKLLVLQDKDRKIQQLSKELVDIPARKKLIETRLNEHRQTLLSRQNDLKAKQASAKNLDLEIESQKQRILKLREQQSNVRTNDEYRAIEREVAGVQTQITGLEDQEIALMEEAEAARERIREIEAVLKREEESVQSEWADQDVRLKNINADLERLKQERSTLTPDIDHSWLSRYDRTFKHTGDFALVPIENGSCGGCHMKLPPQMAQDVKKGAGMVCCSFCGRLLYWRV